jgi:hypothetical protein
MMSGFGEVDKDIFELRVKQTVIFQTTIPSTQTPPVTNLIKIHPVISETKNVN